MDIRDQVRQALGRTAASVHVVATRNQRGDFFAATVTAVSVVTLDPPTMLVCVNQSSAIDTELSKAKRFSLNLLGESQIAVASACAGGRPHDQREKCGDWRDDPHGVPVLCDGLASMTCEVSHVSSIGTHHMYIGTVISAQSAPVADPMIYLSQHYGGFRSSARISLWDQRFD